MVVIFVWGGVYTEASYVMVCDIILPKRKFKAISDTFHFIIRCKKSRIYSNIWDTKYLGHMLETETLTDFIIFRTGKSIQITQYYADYASNFTRESLKAYCKI